jgi:SPP1 gp7 family putative phage head morphogenesis protein
MTLLRSRPILQAESRLIALFDRTFEKAAKTRTLDFERELPWNVRQWFGSSTFALQLDKIITEIIRQSLLYADGQMKKLSAATVKESHILTEEAVRISGEISDKASEAIVRMLKDDAIYYKHPYELAKRIDDLWDGQRYKAVAFAQTFTADVATATTVHRYRQYGVEYMEFDAELDDRTTDQCRCLDGTIFDLSKDSVDRYRPPLHHRCRSGLRPIPITRTIDENKLFENRDFSGTLDDPEDIAKAFGNIEKFNEKYRISQYVIDQDLAARIMLEKGVSVGVSGPDLDIILKLAPTKKGTGLVDVKGNPITSMQEVFDSIDNKAPTIEIPFETRQQLSNGALKPYQNKIINIVDIKGNSETGGYIKLDSGEQLYIEWSQIMKISRYVKEDIKNAAKRNKKQISEWVVKERNGNFILRRD